MALMKSNKRQGEEDKADLLISLENSEFHQCLFGYASDTGLF